MMKPLALKFTLAAATALTLAACRQQPPEWSSAQDTAVCTDRSGNRVPDRECERPVGGAGGNAFLWYYLARSIAVPYYGERVSGGSFSRTAGATYFHAPVATAMTRSAAIARGGFGASARAFGGFGE